MSDANDENTIIVSSDINIELVNSTSMPTVIKRIRKKKVK